jgi:tRNA modification GTPase
MKSDTIFAPSSGSGPAGIAIIRISGSKAGAILDSFSGLERPKPRFAMRASIFDPKTADVLDEGLVIWFPGPGSFTGEDVVELHIHGGQATTEAICCSLSEFEGCRIAEPGEFSRRAFYNNKLDLTEIEGLADLIAAETEGQRKQALKQLSGNLSLIYEAWRKNLLRLLAYAEAALDFPDEELPDNLIGTTKHKILGISKEITQYIDDKRQGERMRDGIQVAIVGSPNVGKSSLVNYLAQRDVAIVSEQEGTTRDVIEVRLDLAGFPVTVADTAGMRTTSQLIELEGVRRAKNRALSADFSIIVFDAGALEKNSKIIQMVRPNDIVVINKADLVGSPEIPLELQKFSPIIISVKTGLQLDVFLKTLTKRVATIFSNTGAPPLTRLRHREALSSCLAALSGAIEAPEVELMAEDLRLAVRELGRITGRVDVEDVLDIIFGEFCIGK